MFPDLYHSLFKYTERGLKIEIWADARGLAQPKGYVWIGSTIYPNNFKIWTWATQKLGIKILNRWIIEILIDSIFPKSKFWSCLGIMFTRFVYWKEVCFFRFL